MPVDKEKFLEGEEIGTSKEEIRKGVLNFLSSHPNKAYSLVEIIPKISFNSASYIGSPNMTYLISVLEDLIEENKIVSRRIKKKAYYAIR